MAGKKAGKWTRVFVEGYDLTTSSNAVAPSNAYAKVEMGGYTQDMSYLNGRGDGSIVLDGFFDDTTNLSHDAMKTLSSGDSTALVTVMIGDNATPTVGDVSYHLKGIQHIYDVTPDLNGAVAVHGEWGAKGDPLEYGVVLADATITATGAQSSYDGLAQTTAGGVGYFHITGLSAGDTITILIEDSANDSTWATLITCTLDGTALDGERIEVSGTVDQYIRASYTVTGSSISFPIAVGFIRL